MIEMYQIAKKIIFFLFFGFFLVAFTAIGIYRYSIGQLFYYDFGIFAHIIWQLSRFQVPIIDHLALGRIVFLGDHFNPGLALLAPLFWLTSDIRILLVEQAVAITGSGVMIFLIARKYGLRFISSLGSAAAYLLFAGTENPLVTDWHPESTAALSLLAFFYYYQFSSRRFLYIIFFLIFLSFKESNALSACALLVVLFFINKTRRIETIVLFVLSLLYFILATKIFIPYFSHRNYMYSPELPFSPLKIGQNFVNSPAKIKLIQDSLTSFGYLPVLSGLGLIPVFAELAQRLAPNSTIFNNISLGQHYNVLLGVFLALATIQGMKNIQKWTGRNTVPERLFAVYLLIVSLYIARKVTGAPINLAANQTFLNELAPRQPFFQDLQKVPAKGSVMAQNNLLPYTAARNEDISLPQLTYADSKPDIILFDLSVGQNPNNFYGSDPAVLEHLKISLETDPHYRRIQTKNTNMYLYVRK